ncbi:hypothetical protein OSTOST_11028 [Ostertagia ostertagi]
MSADNLMCFGSNPKLPLLIKQGASRQWMSNLSNKKLNYKLTFENPNSCFSINSSQTEGEIPEQGQLLIDFNRRPGKGQEDKLIIEYKDGNLAGRTVVAAVERALDEKALASYKMMFILFHQWPNKSPAHHDSAGDSLL